jgi:hypothetical protein
VEFTFTESNFKKVIVAFMFGSNWLSIFHLLNLND